MKTSQTILLAALAVGVSALLATAQDGNNPSGNRPPRRGGQGGEQGPGPSQGGPGQGGSGQGGQRMVPPIMAALDANRDGEIDAKEIANASNALKTLDKNGDGKLTRDEIRPAGGPGQGGPGQGGPGSEGGGQGGPRGPRGPRGGGSGGEGQQPPQ